MSFSYKKWIGVGIILVLAVLVHGYKTEAQTAAASSSACPTGTQLIGWGWSGQDIGLLSFNSRDVGAGGGPYCVSIDSSNNLVGWAWSSNIGWVKFGGLSNFPSGATPAVNARVGSSGGQQVFEGWARACAGTASGDCSSMTSRTDGWDGWIELSAVSHPITFISNAVSGYAWGNDVIGWLSLNLTATTSTTVITTGAAQCQLTNTQVESNAWKLEWTSSNASYCSGNFSAKATSGSTIVQPGVTYVYNMNCTPVQTGQANGFCSTTVTVGGSNPGDPPLDPGCPTCGNGGDPGPLQMWVNNDIQEKLSYQQVRVKHTGAAYETEPVNINWRPTTGDTYTNCIATLHPVQGGTNIIASIAGIPKPNGSPYIRTDIPVGTYDFSLVCTSETTGTAVGAKVKGTSASTMTIRIKDPNESEI